MVQKFTKWPFDLQKALKTDSILEGMAYCKVMVSPFHELITKQLIHKTSSMGFKHSQPSLSAKSFTRPYIHRRK